MNCCGMAGALPQYLVLTMYGCRAVPLTLVSVSESRQAGATGFAVLDKQRRATPAEDGMVDNKAKLRRQGLAPCQDQLDPLGSRNGLNTWVQPDMWIKDPPFQKVTA